MNDPAPSAPIPRETPAAIWPAGGGENLDITERKQTEEALRASEEQHRRLVQHLHAGVVVHDAETRILLANVQACSMLGLTHDQMMGKTAVDPAWCFVREDQTVMPREEYPVNRVLSSREPLRDQVLGINHADGGRTWVLVNAFPELDPAGAIARVVVTFIDLTARKRAEAALRESEERFRVAQELSPDGFAILRPVRDSDGRIVDFTFVYENAAIARINGTDPAAVVGRRISEFLPAHGQSPFHEVHARVADTGETCIMERKYDGGDIPRPTWFRVVVVRTGQDIAILSQDITERKQAEAALAAAHRQTQSLIDNTTALIFACDLEERFVIANAALAALLKTTPEQLIGKRRHEFMPQADADAHEANDQKVIAAGQAVEVEEHSDLHGRSITWLSTKFPLRDEQRRIYGVAGIVTDITERKQMEEALRESEARFRLALKHSPVLVTMQDTNLVYRWVFNTQTRRPEEVVGKTDADLFAPAEAAALSAAKRQVLETGRDVRQAFWLTSNGKRVFLDCYYEPMRDAAGKIIGVGGASVNLTEQKQAEEDLKASVHEKELLLQEVHHRVKNNLQVISSLISLQSDVLKEPDLRAAMEDLRDRVRAMALVHEKLYQSSDFAGLNFAEYASSLVQYLQRTQGEAAAPVRVVLTTQPVTLPVATAVPCGLILNELTSNAFKHAFPGRSEGEVIVGLERDPATNRICLSVRDNGTGLPPNLDWRRSSTLGLRLVQMLTQQIGGAVEARSGPGTEFRVTFAAPAEA